MNCLETRRVLLADPRRRTTSEVLVHLATCVPCSGMAAGLSELDDRIAEAASPPIPEALADRILLGRVRRRPKLHYAAAAALFIAGALGLVIDTDLFETTTTVDMVGPGHPAVVAISEVEQDVPHAPLSDAEASRELEQVLGRLGLALKKGEATAHYVGKCQVTGTACDQIVLSTQDAQANVMLVPEYPLGQRVLVSDGRMSALVSPVRAGGYIVVADTPKNARRMARMLVKG